MEKNERRTKILARLHRFGIVGLTRGAPLITYMKVLGTEAQMGDGHIIEQNEEIRGLFGQFTPDNRRNLCFQREQRSHDMPALSE